MKKNKNLIEFKVKEILSKQLNIDIEKITSDSFLREELGMDSFASLEIVYDLKEAFKIEISNEVIPKMKKVKNIVNYISNCLV